MNIVKRWTTTITASFDSVMNQVENHDALVSAAIREMQSAGAKARAQLLRINRDGEQMERRIVELQEVERLWEERAVRTAPQERERAIECLKRRNGSRREQEMLQRQLKEHRTISVQLERDLGMIRERVSELRRKQSTMNARQYRAEALKAGQLSELGMIGEIDEVFSRWESRIGEYELFTSDGADELERELKDEELNRDLNQELDKILSTKTAQSDPK